MQPQLAGSFIASAPCTLELGDGFRFRHGTTIAPFSIVYETYGELNASRSNAVLVCHALSANAHAAGRYSESDEKPGWWDGMIGHGKGIDLASSFVICVNFPSGGQTTSPHSIDPQTGTPYGSRYPSLTIEDMVESQRIVLDHLGITRLRAVAGGSLGGMQALMWAAMYPERVGAVICMAAAAAVPVEGIAWHLIGRKIIEADPHFRGGDYYGIEEPLRGLQLARMVGHMTYLSQEALESKFGRRRRGTSKQFEVDSYLEYQGTKYSRTRDANAHIRIQAAMDEMDLDEQYGSIARAFSRFEGPALVIAFDTDWLFPPADVLRVRDGFAQNGIDVTYHEIATSSGHDAFLIDFHLVNPPVRDFLSSL